MNVILGSSSPRRKMILGGLIHGFKVLHPSVDETPLPGEDPEIFSRRVSEDKCRSIFGSGAAGKGHSLIITADTIVTIDGRVIGKPDDFEDAVGILGTLDGRTHRVITAITLAEAGTPGGATRFMTGSEQTTVTFKKLGRAGILHYLGTIEYLDKAGSYAFQENGSMIIEGYRGSVTNIIGFPLRLFFAMTAEMGLTGRLFQI